METITELSFVGVTSPDCPLSESAGETPADSLPSPSISTHYETRDNVKPVYCYVETYIQRQPATIPASPVRLTVTASTAMTFRVDFLSFARRADFIRTIVFNPQQPLAYINPSHPAFKNASQLTQARKKRIVAYYHQIRRRTRQERLVLCFYQTNK